MTLVFLSMFNIAILVELLLLLNNFKVWSGSLFLILLVPALKSIVYNIVFKLFPDPVGLKILMMMSSLVLIHFLKWTKWQNAGTSIFSSLLVVMENS